MAQFETAEILDRVGQLNTFNQHRFKNDSEKLASWESVRSVVLPVRSRQAACRGWGDAALGRSRPGRVSSAKGQGGRLRRRVRGPPPADLIKWMFIFWVGTMVPLVGPMIALIKL
jgi:hypothetical protein